MSYTRCHACRGQKKVRGLGCMLKKCLECSGTGYIEQDEQSEVIEVQDETLEEAVEETSKTESTKPKSKRWVKKDA